MLKHENPNIEIINKNLWAVRFSLIPFIPQISYKPNPSIPLEQVNKQFVIGGATAQEQSNAMIQLTQAMAAGALRGEELNSILDGAPGIARAIEKYMGIAEGSIKTVAQEGKVTAEVVKNAMFAMADETNAKFDSMPKT